MKTQIARLSPHQNAKVFGVLTALGSLIFVIPMAILVAFIPPGVDAAGNAVNPPSPVFLLLLPFGYLLMGYLMTVVGCALYNWMYPYLGGIEYESRDQ